MNGVVLLFLVMVLIVIWYLHQRSLENFMQNEPTILRLKNLLLPYFPELHKVKLMKGDSSYTINKHRIYICTESDGEYYNDNMLIYVILHELAHTLCKSLGHSDEFQLIFNTLMQRAEKAGVYDPKLPRTENYCRIKSTNNG
jgi:hypothetical protein